MTTTMINRSTTSSGPQMGVCDAWLFHFDTAMECTRLELGGRRIVEGNELCAYIVCLHRNCCDNCGFQRNLTLLQNLAILVTKIQ